MRDMLLIILYIYIFFFFFSCTLYVRIKYAHLTRIILTIFRLPILLIYLKFKVYAYEMQARSFVFLTGHCALNCKSCYRRYLRNIQSPASTCPTRAYSDELNLSWQIVVTYEIIIGRVDIFAETGAARNMFLYVQTDKG